MAVTTLGRQAVRDALPDKFKSYADKALDKGLQQQLTTALAKWNPQAYIDILQKLNAIGESTVSVYGKDTTITLDDLDAGAQVKNANKKLKELIRVILNRKDLTPEQKEQKVVQLGYKYTGKMKDLGLQDAKRRRTGIANQIASKSRGNPVQLMQLIVGDMQMRDAANRDIPYLATMPYVDGDSPMSYWASAMSGRKSTYDTQAATGMAGYLNKQATNVINATPIAQRDCGTTSTGVPVKADDPQNVGAILLRPWKNHPAGSPVTEDMLQEAEEGDQFIIRSPTTCKSHSGVCAMCSGIQQDGKLPAIGSYVALNSMKSFIQPLTQAGVSCLHPDTVVSMANGTEKPIKDIQVNDLVIGCDKSGKTTPAKVNFVFHNGVQPVYRTVAVTQTGQQKVLLSTLKHKVLLYVNDAKLPQILPVGTPGEQRWIALSDRYEESRAKIISQEYIGDCQTVDIEVDHNAHLFQLAEGQVVSNSKHGSGMGGKNQDPQGPDQPTGFDSISRMLLAPSTFPGGAVLSQVDGRVNAVRQAPQGGFYITVGTTTVYSPKVRTVTVKPGDIVEAGDTLTNGVPNPMQIVKYKGIGQGRHYYTQKLNQLLPKSGAGTARRNVQQFARAMINKVKITNDQGFGGYYPGDITDYDDIAKKWKPRDNSKILNLKQATGKYLEEPALYYSIGTRLTPKVISKLQQYGYTEVNTNEDPPPFQPQFVSSKAFSMTERRWIPRLNGQRLKQSIFDAARIGITDPYDSPSYIDKIVAAPYNPANIKPAGI